MLTEDGTPVPNVIVTALPSPPQRTSGTAATDASGRYDIGGLGAGSYSVCTQQAGSAFIDPCIWSANPPKITLQAGQAWTGYTVRVMKGQILKVHINDPAHLLSSAAGAKGVPNHVLAGVWSNGNSFLPLVKVSENSGS